MGSHDGSRESVYPDDFLEPPQHPKVSEVFRFRVGSDGLGKFLESRQAVEHGAQEVDKEAQVILTAVLGCGRWRHCVHEGRQTLLFLGLRKPGSVGQGQEGDERGE